MTSLDFRNRLYAFCNTTSGSHCVLNRSAPHSCWSLHQLWLPHARHRLVWNISIPLVGHLSIQSVLVHVSLLSFIIVIQPSFPGGGRVLCTSIKPFKTTLTVHKLPKHTITLTITHVQEAIQHSKINNSVGPDNLSIRHLKHIGPLGLTFLTSMYTTTLNKNIIPHI